MFWFGVILSLLSGNNPHLEEWVVGYILGDGLIGDDEGEGAALFGRAFEPDTAVIRFHQCAYNRKPNADAA